MAYGHLAGRADSGSMHLYCSFGPLFGSWLDLAFRNTQLQVAASFLASEPIESKNEWLSGAWRFESETSFK